MTLVLGTKSDARGLQQINFGVNEIVSALTLSKQFGSLFSRKQDAQVFDVLRNNYDMSIDWVPPWLADFKFSRATSIHGCDMRRVEGPLLLQDVELKTIEGIAAVVVLIAKYADSVDRIVDTIEKLLTHRLPTRAIYPGKAKEAEQSAFRNWTPLLRSWVEAILSADSDTSQVIRTRKYLSELAVQGARAGKDSHKWDRVWLQNIRFIQDFLGYCGADEESSDLREQLGRFEHTIRTNKGTTCKQRVFNTFAASTASLALAAAANGADVSVECVTFNDGTQQRTMLPLGKEGESQYLVRLWLCKPPLEVYELIRPVEVGADEEAEARDDSQSTVIFGGNMETAVYAAQKLDFWTQSTDDAHSERAVSLWKAGIELGATIPWKVRRFNIDEESQIATEDHIYLQAEMPTQVPVDNEHVERLASHRLKVWLGLNPPRTTTMHNLIANVIHEQYNYSRGYQGSIFQAAMDFVAVAVMIGMVDSLIVKQGRRSTYAFSMEFLRSRNGTSELLNYFKLAVFEGITPSSLLWAAASIWGGSSPAMHGHMSVTDRVVGIVAPQCTVLLDFLRDPLRLAKSGLREPIISLHYGSVPLLFRNPSNGFVFAAVDAFTTSRRRTLLKSFEDTTASSQTTPECDLVIQLEPNITSRRGSNPGNYLVCYYMGDLAFELDPYCVMLNLLLRRGDIVDPHGVLQTPALSSLTQY
ncbi:hypothetical protein BDV96DRAFT_648414 [Lophiotrema nucula]|uniref:Uncharacterized protein n=1 Tax=Lophiotrema nucula TaxID=690887 RepID=A0A6A5Z308_9PLEO|nr:hypothetical protein BDV96DRAFT_648414 [Lophiotrema nucula]